MESARRWSLTNTALCTIIWILVTYIAINVAFDNGGWQTSSYGMSPLPNPRWRGAAGGLEEDEKCRTRDGHFEDDDADGNKPQNAWRQMKWIGQPAACPVRGKVIERLDPLNNFRRGFALRFAGNVEDRIHILPWLLGAKVDLNRRRRRVYLDLGSNSFSSSIQWFMQMYPCDFTEVHAFEIEKELLVVPPPFDEKSNRAVGNPASLRANARPGIPGWMLKRIKVYNKLVADGDDVAMKAINVTRFIKEELRLTPDDAVIVKMDIEESEWPILTRWSNDPDMVEIIDEIFVEVHYKHSSMYNYHWHKFKHDRKEAKRLLADLRWKGFYIHFWP